MIKYVLRGCRYMPAPTNKPDGMMVRNDGWWTDNKDAVKLFDTPQEAEDFFTNFCLPLWQTHKTTTSIVFIVETEVKYVASKVGKTSVKQLS